MQLRAVDSLARRVELERDEWRRVNDVRRDLAYPHLQRRILEAASNPSRHIKEWLWTGSLLSILVWLVDFQFHPRGAKPLDTADSISYLSALWAAQAAVVALVYPIVIGFVALLFQGRLKTKAVLYIYLHDSAALLAGLSSLALIALIGAQHFFMYRASTGIVLVWNGIASLWFLVNMLLTSYFLVRTFEFLLPDKRARIVQRYAVNFAWPDELRDHLSETFFVNAALSKWLPGNSFGQEAAEAAPKILLGAAGLGMGDELLSADVGRNRRVVDVWLRPLRWAVASWLRRAKAKQAAAGSKDEAPVLVFPITPGGSYSGKVTLCRAVGGLPLTPLEQSLIKASFRFGSAQVRPFKLSVKMILAELEAEADECIANDQLVAYEEKLDELVELYSLLIRASICTDTEGRDENYTRVSESSSWIGTPVFKSWSRSFLRLYERASRALDTRADYVRKSAYLPARLFSRLLERGHPDILIHTIHLFPHLQMRTGDWWQNTLQRQGIKEHGPCARQTLRPPEQKTYESALIQLVAAWSSLKNERFPPRISETPTWDDVRKSAPYFQEHLSETLQMMLGSVFRGDQAGAEWWCDLLLKWWDQLEHRFDRGTFFLRRERFINIELTRRTWAEVLAEVDVQAFRGVERAPLGVFAASVRNLWVDACCIAMYVLAQWGRDCNCQLSLASHILHALVRGTPFKAGGAASGRVRPVSNAGDLLAAIVRQNYGTSSGTEGYRSTLDKWVESIGRISEREWVAGWIYSGWGSNDLDSLRHGQIVVLSLFMSGPWDPIQQIDEVLRRWVREDESKLRDLRSDLGEWTQFLQGQDMAAYKGLFDCYNEQSEPKFEFQVAITQIAQAIETIAERVDSIRQEALRGARVSDERLRAIERWASELAFKKESADFPVSSFREVLSTAEVGERRSLILQRLDKGEYTEPPMAQRAINEDEWFAETVKRQVAGFVMGQIIRQLHIESADGSTSERYWAEVKRFRDRAVAAGHQPLLLVENPTIPDWVWEWSLTEWEKDREPPYGLRLTRDPNFTEASDYLGSFGEVALFNAPLPAGASYLLALEALERIEFTKHPSGFVSATWQAVGDEERLIDLTLSWNFRLQLRDLPAVRLTYPRKAGEPS